MVRLLAWLLVIQLLAVLIDLYFIILALVLPGWFALARLARHHHESILVVSIGSMGVFSRGWLHALSIELLFFDSPEIKVLRPILARYALELPVDVDVLREL